SAPLRLCGEKNIRGKAGSAGIYMITLDARFFKRRSACPLCHNPRNRAMGRPRFQRLYEAPQGVVALTAEVEDERQLARCAGCGRAGFSKASWKTSRPPGASST